MKIEVKVPSVGESITEATIGSWTKKSGEFVKRNEIIMMLETDKASVEVISENDGVLTINAQAGEVVKIGATVGFVDTSAAPTASATPAAAPTVATTAPAPQAAMAASGGAHSADYSPAVQRIVSEKNLDTSNIAGTGKDGRLTKGDVLSATPTPAAVAPVAAKAPMSAPAAQAPAGEKKLVPMTTIRKKIAERLVQAQQNAAILTTFNEFDMTQINEIRAKYKDKFKEKYGVGLGFNGFFVKAAIEALKAYPAVNAWISGNDIEYHNYYNIGIAVSTDKGLMVPVIKNADKLSVAGIELAIRDIANKARDGKVTPDDLSGGTFTITNGGVFGSLMSTPILNAPQSGILGLHKVEDRPMAVNGQVVIRPMMYAALSYDHRIIDGRDSVGFLVKIKEGVENPERLLLEV